MSSQGTKSEPSSKRYAPEYPSSNYQISSPVNYNIVKAINWQKYIFLFVKNWTLFLIVMAIALGIAFFKIRYTIPNYQATATLIIQDEENSQDILGELRAVRYWRRQADMANEKAKLSSFSTIQRAIDSLGQDLYWTAHGRIRVRPLYKNTRFNIRILSESDKWYIGKEWFIDYIDTTTFHFYQENNIDTILPLNTIVDYLGWKFEICLIPGGDGHPTYSFIVNDKIQLTKQHQQRLSVGTEEKEGTIITMQSQGPVGEREVDFLNALSKIYILSELEKKQTAAANTSIFIDNQINIIIDSLHQAEDQLLTYRLTNNVINLSREGDIAFERLKTFHERRTQLKLKENYYSYLKDYIDKRNDPQSIIAPALIDAKDQVLISTISELQKLYEERETLDFSVSDSNPGIEQINDRIRAIRLRIIEIIDGLIDNNNLSLNQLTIEENAVLAQLKTLPISEQQLLNITRKYDLYNQFYTYLLQKSAESGIQKASALSNARILDPARYDQLVQVGNNKQLILLIAIILGLLIPSIVIILRDTLDDRITERDDITFNTDIPIIGTIGHSDSSGILTSGIDSNSAFTESLRRIRTNLAFALKEKSRKVIMVTSSVSGEGKTFTAANLAAIIAMNNKKVLLVGFDLRKPALHRIFNMSNDIGLTSYIIGESSKDDIIFGTKNPNLFIIPAGPIPPNPAELTETQILKELFDQLYDEYDYIIIDTPPIALVADALSISNYADITLYLVRQNHSHRSVLSIANTMNNEGKLPQTYLLINDLRPSKHMGLYYYYGYGKGYGYGYGYYSDKYSGGEYL